MNYNEYISTWILDTQFGRINDSDIEDVFTDVFTFGLGVDKDIVLDKHKNLYTIYFMFTSLPGESNETHRNIDRMFSLFERNIIETKGPELIGHSNYESNYLSDKFKSLSFSDKKHHESNESNESKKRRSSYETDLSNKVKKLKF
jgi:hypothetical protein